MEMPKCAKKQLTKPKKRLFERETVTMVTDNKNLIKQGHFGQIINMPIGLNRNSRKQISQKTIVILKRGNNNLLSQRHL